MTTIVVGVYLVLAAATLVVAGAVTRSWWSAAVGALLLVAGGVTLFGTGEATSWFRGDVDERRQHAVDASFRVAFLVLAWWVAAVTAIASFRAVPLTVWSAGIVVALAAAYANYAVTLRRI